MKQADDPPDVDQKRMNKMYYFVLKYADIVTKSLNRSFWSSLL